MTDSFPLSKSIAVWHKLLDWHWDMEVGMLPTRLQHVADGRTGEGAAAISSDLQLFAIVKPTETIATFGALAPTLDPAVADQQVKVGANKPVGVYEISLASAGNALECLGFAVASATWATVRGWLPRLEVSRDDKHVYEFWNAGLIAIALGDRATARRIAGHRGTGAIPFQAGATFEMNMRGFIQHLAGAVESGASAEDVTPGFLEFIGNFPRYESGKAADEATLLWAARIVHHHLGKQPVGTTAQFLHDTIWKLA